LAKNIAVTVLVPLAADPPDVPFPCLLGDVCQRGLAEPSAMAGCPHRLHHISAKFAGII
jgi:hypothetical protein